MRQFRRRAFVALVWGLFVPLFVAPFGTVRAADESFDVARQAMVAEVAEMARTIGTGGSGDGKQAIDAQVMAVLARVLRHEFVPPKQRASAYENRPLPIGHGQTISQPYMVAVMTEQLALQPGQHVLEIGTGSGYQAAVLAEMGARVSTIEIIEALATESAARLRRLGYAQVATRQGDGYEGWPQQAPFDAIIVTAAASHVPPPLLRQLKPGGRMLIPLGAAFQQQQLVRVDKHLDGRVTTRQLMPVSFVPLTGGHD